MEVGDHSECPVKLLACLEHRDQQLQAMGILKVGEYSLHEGLHLRKDVEQWQTRNNSEF